VRKRQAQAVHVDMRATETGRPPNYAGCNRLEQTLGAAAAWCAQHGHVNLGGWCVPPSRAHRLTAENGSPGGPGPASGARLHGRRRRAADGAAPACPQQQPRARARAPRARARAVQPTPRPRSPAAPRRRRRAAAGSAPRRRPRAQARRAALRGPARCAAAARPLSRRAAALQGAPPAPVPAGLAGRPWLHPRGLCERARPAP